MVQFSGRFVYLRNCGKVAKYGIGKCRSGSFSELGFEDFVNGPTRGPANDIPILSRDEDERPCHTNNTQSSAIYKLTGGLAGWLRFYRACTLFGSRVLGMAGSKLGLYCSVPYK
jgi:hypothetical protein